MVLEIRLSNFYSVKDEVILDLRAGNMQSKRAKELADNKFTFNNVDVLKVVALYGANASGKSALIRAIRFCHAMVFESHHHNENTTFNFAPFKFAGYAKKPSTYFIRFVTEAIEYEYSFSLRQTEILTESLYYYPNGRRAKVFDRNEQGGKKKKDKYSFGTSVIKRPLDVAESTSSKTLFISRASQMDREIPKKVFTYFHQTFILKYLSYSIKHADAMIQSYKQLLLQALRLADSDIVDFKHKVRLGRGKNLTVNPITEEALFKDIDTEDLEIKTYHQSSPNTPFAFAEESLGTQKLFFIMLTVLDIVKNNKVLLIDEIEDSLHPHIIEYILTIFNTSAQAQLIFSTHNTNLLDLNKLRKDQVWFVNKRADGSTDLYSLYDYSDFRDTMNLERAYLQGRFNAVPVIDNSHEQLQALTNG